MIDTDFIEQSVEIDDTLICFIDFFFIYADCYRFLTGNFWPSEILYRGTNYIS